MEVYTKYQKEIVTGLIVGAIILIYLNRNYIQSKISGLGSKE
ncbi:hypothetical protein [Brumimicrobium mesophilum]|nr:hypothetical protein [Brumimicrobium mesophilum]